MKAVLFALLAAAWALRPGAALQCYFCESEVDNEECKHVQNCSLSETQCRTERVSAISFLTVINKGCSSHCEEGVQNDTLGQRNITCCSTDLCNTSGAHAPQPAVVTLTLLTTVLSLLLCSPSPQ